MLPLKKFKKMLEIRICLIINFCRFKFVKKKTDLTAVRNIIKRLFWQGFGTGLKFFEKREHAKYRYSYFKKVSKKLKTACHKV